MSDPKLTPEQLAADLKKAQDDIRAKADEALGRAEKGEKLTEGLKEQIDEALLKMGELTEQVAVLEQKGVRDPGQGASRSLGQMFVDDEGVKSFLDGRPTKGKADMMVKATITSLTTDAAGSAGDAIAPARLPGVQMMPNRRMTIRDLLMSGRTESNVVQYVQETGFTNSAAPVAEGAKRAESDVKLELVNGNVATIGHYMKASREVLNDAPMLASMIDGRLRYGVDFKEEVQLLSGDGTGQNLSGLVTEATAYSVPGSLTAENLVDTLRFAALQVYLAEFPSSAFVLNPIDWAFIETLKDDIGNYIIGDPQSGATPTLWRLPVVQTPAMTVDKFLTGAFDSQAQVFDREQTRVEVGYENDDFTKGLVTILADERLALAVYRPEAFVYGDLGRIA
ncbi:phage major capsid protein [Maritimibacter sp. DP1N21-5]|uniref:phage major capsid protein n=1 Tax=Maritimibacter sp. DP1N21-5 TaxID=2836867 RepID=UPI001C48ECAC|nr:phage major capsid protein [Maritimibacter sp. DP1N21-5]MBV7408198.1 phage major capsid protein [Maritimibacter sp. DP1N21-5]